MSTLRTVAPLDQTAPGADRIVGLRGLRYGEVLIVRQDGGGYHAEIWNSMGLGDCPQQAWDALEPTEITTRSGAVLTLLNGPRHWLMDVIENIPPANRRVERFGSIDMSLVATLDFGASIPTPGPYLERRVRRDTVWEWSVGREVHELVTDHGDVFVMQAYCLAVDPNLDESSLADIGERLTLPEGWTFRSRTLDEPLRLRAPDGVATVLQDELQNTYMC